MIVVVGEALIDIVHTGAGEGDDPGGASAVVSETVGGGPLNIAVGLSRLEQPAALITQIGDDERGRTILAALAADEVDVINSPTTRTSTATATLDQAGVASYSFDLTWDIGHRELPECDVLHVGSLGTVLEPGRGDVVDLVDQAWRRDVFVSYDPNVRPAFLDDPQAAWRDIESIADRCGLVKMSDEDVELIHPGADPGDIARSLLGGERTELVVITHGSEGAWAYASHAEAFVPTPRIDLVDTVGAGDSFMSALLAILYADQSLNSYAGNMPDDRGSLTRVLSGAVNAAAITCSRRGANPPRRSELPANWPG